MRQRRIISTPIHERYPKRQTALNKLEKFVPYFNTIILLRNERHKLKLKSKSTNERCKINAAKKNLAFETHLSRPCSLHFRQTIQSYTVRRISLLGSLRVDEDGSRIGNTAAGLISKSWWYLSSYLSQFFARPARTRRRVQWKIVSDDHRRKRWVAEARRRGEARWRGLFTEMQHENSFDKLKIMRETRRTTLKVSTKWVDPGLSKILSIGKLSRAIWDVSLAEFVETPMRIVARNPLLCTESTVRCGLRKS